MELKVYNTHIEISPYTKDQYPVIEKMYESIDSFSGESKPCGYLIDNNILYVPRGTPVSKLQSLTETKPIYIEESDPMEKMSMEHGSYFEPRDDLQYKSIKFLKEPDHQLALNLKTGSGKGNFISTKIPTPDGWTTMGEIKVGDYVFNSHGKPVEVIGVYPKGIMDAYEVSFNDGRIAHCSEDHLWLASDTRKRRSKYKLYKLKDMIKDYKSFRYRKYYKYKIPMLSDPVEYKEYEVPVDPYVIGALVDKGFLSNGTLSMFSTDSYIPSRVMELSGFYGMKKYPDKYTYIFTDKNDKLIETSDFLKDIPELINTYIDERSIPDLYMYNSLDVRLKLLQGLMDSGGEIEQKGSSYVIIYRSKSNKLLNQIKELIQGLGFIARVSKNNYLIIDISYAMRKYLFTNPKKHSYAEKCVDIKDESKFNHLTITNIQKTGKEECVCIMVNDPEHLYLCDDFIVTHNTYVTAYASSDLSLRTMIITPNEAIKQQWIKTYTTMFDYKDHQVMNISGSSIINNIMKDQLPEADVYVVNHQTLHSYLMNNNPYIFHKFFNKLKIGIKVYDESHLNFANILMIDSFTNTDRTWYLTATFDRSDKTESACFKRAFSSLIEFGYKESTELTPKHTIYHIVNVNSRIEPRAKYALMGYPGFTAQKYGRYAIFNDPSNTVYKAILSILNLTKDIEGKILIFIPIIDGVDEVCKRLKHDFTDKTVAAYHSKISKDEKESAENKDIIVTTVNSLGTGKDIKDLRIIISAQPMVSKVNIEQTLGRIRPYGEGKDTYYFDIVDVSIPACNYWLKSRMKKVSELVKESKVLNF